MSAHARPLLSRVADAVYWMGRYIERAENVARFIDVNQRLALDLPWHAGQWEALIDIGADRPVFVSRYGTATRENVVRFHVFDELNPNSIASCIHAARENARTVRETISSETWQQVNSMHLMLKQHQGELTTDELPEFCRRIRMSCHLFQGITDATMSRNEAWNIVRFGRKLERADKTTRILDVKYFVLLPSVNDVGTPYDDVQWSAVLRSVSGFEMYRQRHGAIEPTRVVEFLLLDDKFPRAVRYCVDAADDALHALTGSPPGTYSFPSEQRLGLLRGELDFGRVDTILAGGLHEYLDSVQLKLNQVGESFQRDFVAQTHASAAGA